MLGFSENNWSPFAVKKPDQAPKGPHWAAVLFGKRTEVDSYSGTSSHQVDETTYYAFTKEEQFATWVAEASISGRKFFCFKVNKLGEIDLKVKVDVGV